MANAMDTDDKAYSVLFALVALLLSLFIFGVRLYSHNRVPFNDMWCKVVLLAVVVGLPLYVFLRFSKRDGTLAILSAPFVQLALMPVVS